LPPGVFSFAQAPPFPFPLVFIIFALPASFSMYILWIEGVRQKELAETEQLKSELNFLKSQISPHFLFNSLNTIYALSQSNPEKSGEVTLKLSKLLRFLVYDTQKEKTIAIAEEIEFLDNYISLSALRLTAKTQVEFNHQVSDPNFQIPPLLLLIFVENCFKHGVTAQKESKIKIDINQTSNELVFETTNPIIQNSRKQEQSGHVGLINVQRRLELNYSPKEYDLEYGEDNGQFTVRLSLNRI
jgi:LytS/YehU family sensor histidine kinase